MSSLKPNIDPEKFRINGLEFGDTYDPDYSGKIYEPTREKLQAEFDDFEQIDPNKPEHSRELNAVGPKWLFEEANPTRKALFFEMVRYDPKHKTLVTGCYNGDPADLDLISYKHRRFGNIKWRTRVDIMFFWVPLIRVYSDTGKIFFIEGHHDALTALLLGIDFVMVPSSGYRCSNPEILNGIVKGMDIVFLVEDKPAYVCMFRLAEQLRESAYSVTIKLLGKAGIDNKVDLSDLVQSCSSQSEVYDELYN